MGSVASILSVAGVGGIFGGIVTCFLQSWLSRRAALDERRFREKKEAYAGLFNAMYQVAKENSDANVKEAGYWRARVELIGSEQVRHLTNRLFELANGMGGLAVSNGEVELLTAMRADLGIVAPKRE